MTSLFEYLEKSHNPDLTFIDPTAESNIGWGQLVKVLPTFISQQKRLAFLYLDNSVTSVKILLAFLKSNHALCLLSRTLNPELKQKLEKTYSPFYIADTVRGDLTSSSLVHQENGLNVYNAYENTYSVHPDLKILLSTSGTTGSPKLVKLTHANFISNTQSILDYLPVNAEDTCILNLPIHYSYGLSVLFTNIVRGGKIVCSNETVLSRNFWEMFKEYGCTSLAGVPYTYEMLTRIGFTKSKYPALKYMTQAGGKLHEKTLKLFADYSRDNKIEFYVMYGQTEATARMAYLPPAMLDKKIGSIGMPVMGGKCSIDKQSGELIYTGPNVGCGYAESVEGLSECSYLEKLRTGDMAKTDDEGYYYITGRIKRFIKIFGNRVSLDELEADLKKEFNCFAGCTGIEDKTILIFSDNKELDADEVKNYVSAKYQIHISVIKYTFTESIPLTANHKTDYKAIIEANGVR